MEQQTLLQKARVAVGELNQTALMMRKQMESGEIDAVAAEKAMGAAMRKAKRCEKIYFRGVGLNPDEHLRQMREFADADLDTEIRASIGRLNEVLPLYAETAGWTK